MVDFARLGHLPCLVIGRAGMDLYADPPGTSLETATRFTTALGGSSANIAVALTRAGGRAALLSRVSGDAVGRFCRAQLQAYGVDDSLLRVTGGEARTSLALVETRPEPCQAVIYRNGAADFDLGQDDVETLDYSRFGALIVTGTALAQEPSRRATFLALDLARAAGLVLVFDIDHRPYSWTSQALAAETCARAAALCDLVVGNDEEFGLLAGDMALGLDKARSLGAPVVVYKMGGQGAITFCGGQEIRTGIYRTEALKPTGAGDAFLGNLVASLGRGDPLRAALLRGSAAAAIVVSRPGCAPAMPTSDALDRFLASHPGPTG